MAKKNTVLRERVHSGDADKHLHDGKRSAVRRAWEWIWENFPATFCCLVIAVIVWFFMSILSGTGDLSALRNAAFGDTRTEALNICLDNGGDVEIRSDGKWSCHLRNEILRGDNNGKEL